MIKASPWHFGLLCVIAISVSWVSIGHTYKDKLQDARDEATNWKDTADRWKSDAEFWKENSTHPIGAGKTVPEPKPDTNSHTKSPTPNPHNPKTSENHPNQVVGPGSIGIQGNNSGNNTVNNLGPPPLVITERQEQDLASAVRPFLTDFQNQKINISVNNANGETGLFGMQLAKAFTDAGFEVNEGSVTFIGATLSRGVTIRFGKTHVRLAEAVRDSLLRNGIVDKVYAAQGINDDDFLIIVSA